MGSLFQLSKKKWVAIPKSQITPRNRARPAGPTSVFIQEHQGSRQHDQTYAAEKSHCLPQERDSKERVRSLPSLQRRCRSMCPGQTMGNHTRSLAQEVG